MIKIGMASFWHVHAGDYARQAEENPNTEIVCIWDEDPERGRAEAERRGVQFVEKYDDMLGEVDAVVVDTPTTMHRDIMIAAAKAGKHIFTEKVIAPTTREVNQILQAVRDHNVKLTVSLPRLYFGYTLAIRDRVRKGDLGELTLVRSRLSHNGAIPTANSPHGWLPSHFFNLNECGGGAMIDLGCHPMYLTRLLLGMPAAVHSTYGYVTGKEVEDNAVSTLKYDNGAIGIVEAGFVNRFSPFTLEVHGTEGSLIYSDHDRSLILRSAAAEEGSGEKWNRTGQFPDDEPDAFNQWTGHILNDTEASENIELAVDLTRLMEASNLSAASGKSVVIRDLQE